MKKIILFILFTSLGLAQTPFSRGFEEGFKKGYCYERGIGCLAPIAPIAPIPNVNEKSDNYTDGYNRGFQVGLDKSRNENQLSNTSSQDRVRFKASSPEFVEDNIYKMRGDLMLKVLEAKERQYEAYVMSAPEREANFRFNLEKAHNAYNISNYSASINYCLIALSNGYQNDFVYYLLGANYYNLGDYDNALINLKKAKNLGNKDSQKFIDYIKDKEKSMDYTKPIQFGVRGGFNLNSINTSFLVGVFLQGNRNIFGIKNFSGIAEVLYYKGALTREFTTTPFDGSSYTTKYEYKVGMIQVNLMLKNRIVKTLDVIYGIGLSSDVDSQVASFLDLNAGVQYNIKHNLFVDGRLSKSIATLSEFDDVKSPLSLQISLGYKF